MEELGCLSKIEVTYMKQKTAAVVVTFNRKELLIKCLDSIRYQSLKPDVIFIIDNFSSDGTPDFLLEKNYIGYLPEINLFENQLIEYQVNSLNGSDKTIKVFYIRKYSNDGGAGGFYEGMKQAFDYGADWIWMMDDDGLTDKEQLSKLIEGAQNFGLEYSNALVTNIDNKDQLAFSLGGFSSVEEVQKQKVIFNVMNPFNGTLISRNLIDKIGFIKREMFIWGDETEYTNRVRKNGFKIATITEAIHLHPLMKGTFEQVFPFFNNAKVIVKPAHFSHIYYRNLGYNQKNYASEKSTNVVYYLYVIYFLTRFKFRELIKFSKYFKKGIKNNFID